MADRRYVRGDVNIILNSLRANGVIAGFRTTFGQAAEGEAVGVTIIPGSSVDPNVALKSVRSALEEFKDEIIITVDFS
jgi:hypothetical protein